VLFSGRVLWCGWTLKVIVPRRNWTRLTDMVDELHRNYSSAAYVFRNNYFFLDLPTVPNETSNITFLRHRLKVCGCVVCWAQYTPPTPTRLDCRVESRRRCVWNSQVGDSFELSTSLNKFSNNKVELRRVSGVNAPVDSRDPVYNFLCSWAIEAGDKWRHNDVIVEKLSISIKLHVVKPAMFSFYRATLCVARS